MPVEHPSDRELLTLVAAGDLDAFALLFQRRQADIYRFALHMTSTPAIADDVTQETFLAVMRDAGRYDATKATVTAWLCGIARNQVRRRLERDRSLQPLDEGESSFERFIVSVNDDPLGDLTRTERIEALRRAVQSLPLRYREAVVLCDLQELSYAEAATALGCAVGTVRSRLHRGREMLALKLAAAERPRTADAAREDPPAASGFSRKLRTMRSARNLA
jgi:RNA polymerase sigma-70 factor (ECF subfamily)